MGKLVILKEGKKYQQVIKQGGIPDEIWEHPITKEYVQNPKGKKISVAKRGVYGFFGSFERTVKTDKAVVHNLRKEGMSDTEIAEWLTSTSGRHMMDDPSRKNIETYTRSAKDDLRKWAKREADYHLKKKLRGIS